MKSIGEHLKTAREEKGFSFDQVVHDTNISREYIHALESDSFDLFPAEAYLIGFLRNYSEYLGLDPVKMVEIYKNYKISEEPVPMDLLLGKKKTGPEKKEQVDELDLKQGQFPRWILPVAAIVLIVVGVSVVFIPSIFKLDKNEDEVKPLVQVKDSEVSSPKEFFLTEETLDIVISNGDKINVSTGNNLVSFSVNLTVTEQSLIYQDMEGLLKKMDLKKDEEQVILIEENNGVYFYVKDVSAQSTTLIAQKVLLDENVENIDAVVDSVDSGITSSAERIAEKIVITTDVYPKAYTIDAFFRGDGLFRHENDDQQAVERFYQAGERLKIDVNRTATLWISNAGIVEIKISGQEISMGDNGQVVVRSVKWIKNNDTGKYELIIVPYN
jgi:cytoskeletal protein RodZ